MDYIRETKEWLSNYNNLKYSIINMNLRLEEVNKSLEGIGSIDYSGMPKGNYKIPDDTIANSIFLKSKLEESLKQTKEAINKMNRILDNMNNEDREILRLTYIEEVRDEEIQKKKGMSRSTLHRNRSKAIKILGSQLFGILAIK